MTELPQDTAEPARLAQTFAEVVYPSGLVEQATLDRTDAYIAEADPAPALRRLLIEGRAGVERALRARAVDIAAGGNRP